MMRVAPAVFELSEETQATREMYGVPDGDNESFAWQCLVARRLVEQGVRTVELIDTGASNNWDAHGNMQDHRPKAQRVDRALAALLTDLKQRGLWDNTLVAICTEFGRSPWDPGKGRNHGCRSRGDETHSDPQPVRQANGYKRMNPRWRETRSSQSDGL